MRQILVPAGIGDNIWLLMKLINSGEKFDFHLPGGSPQRGKQIFDLLPQVSASAKYVDNFPYSKIMSGNIQNHKRNWSEITEKEFVLSANAWLENGKRIEKFLPDLKTSFRINWDLSTADKSYELLNKGLKYIGIYGSAYSTQRAWGFWDENKWLELIKMCGKEYVYIIIGAKWDLDLGSNLIKLLRKYNILHINTIGESLATVTHIMKQLHYFFSFPSGLGILATTVECPVTMFYPPHLKNMINAWASPEDIESTNYKGCLFCTPEEIYSWCKENGKI